ASAPAQRETETEKADRLRAQAESPLALPADSGSVAQDSTTIAVAPQPTEEAAIEDPTPPTPAIDEETQTASLQTDEPVAEVAAPALTGKSRGGRLRQGPGTGFDVAGTIREGTPVTILENAGNTLNGFDWFEIEYGDGQRAYTWGGILCTDGEKADGVFEVCG
ncbi:MAG: SH3 domain-containing protein, partial [Pseudomonadota bacterium]